ncbi:hypothetical protein COCSADRAFT_183086 [Bipolaris sorokiniana ND90Pr]|uniref:Fungal N-terminal domain-containing protein n=1 Tax=Cochliobolus sativus (strain ND90Pr / ATCC 201652) TaxID=665912 RepID=M2R3Z7_COCSN|nr:uncharacterized protein COCSADRAFT_183086 [Bipolaris sorokiniana ND90Pr]EMD61929.1 hypothetical protein COCSADRAFT_183086 [Bipolaris sorokiniana ND90Pr]
MAVLAAILPVVSRSSALALDLFKTAAALPDVAKERVEIANRINGFASILKQVGTIIKEDDRLPSPEAFDVLDDVIEQSQNVMGSLESAISTEESQHYSRRDSARYAGDSRPLPGPSMTTRLAYLIAHLEALSTTLSVLLQTLYTAQSVMWSKLRPTVSPQQAAKVVDNEKTQLETLIIQQQISILAASKIFENASQSDARLLMEDDSSQSLVKAERDEPPMPSHLYPYQSQGLSGLATSTHTESKKLLSVCNISTSHGEHLLGRWTSLPQFERHLQDEELEQRKQRQQSQQATVESDSEEEQVRRSRAPGDSKRRSDGSRDPQPLFTENNILSPESEKTINAQAPPTPADTPHTSNTNLSSGSPRTSVASLPVDAAAAMEAKEEDDVDLEIPWKLCTRKYYWRYIDARQVSSNTDQAPSIAFSERNSWTEIMASWVCKEAIQEARLPYTQVQKERRNSRRTKFETCFCIERPLQFDQVKRLVERTVEIYRKNAPPTPPAEPKARTSSFHQQPPPSPMAQKSNPIDRDRTPVARNTHPPFHRATSSLNSTLPPPPAGAPPLDRSMSMPGPGLVPPLPQTLVNARTPNLQIPIPPGQQYGQHHPPPPQSPRHSYYPTQPSSYPSQPTNTSASPYYPQSPAQNILLPYPNNTTLHPPPLHSSNSSYNTNYNTNHPIQASPLRSSYMNNLAPGYPLGPPSSASNRRYDDDLTTSESELDRPRRSRRERERSRSRYTDRYGDGGKYGNGKKSHTGRKAAAGALLGVGGLTALLDGLSGL